LAEGALIKLGVPITAEPRDVLLQQVYHAYGMQQAASRMLQDVNPEDFSSDDREVKAAAKAIEFMYSEWTDRAARISKMALDVGIEERLVKLAERQGDVIVGIIRAVVIGLELSPELQRKAFVLAATELRQTIDAPKNVTPGAVK
jgi:hypothetical protein